MTDSTDDFQTRRATLEADIKVQAAKRAVMGWLDREGLRGTLSGMGYLPLHVAARYIGAQPGTLRLQKAEGRSPLRWRREGRHWQIELASLVEHCAQQDERDE